MNKKRSYTIKERLAFHKQRLGDSNATAEQRQYSSNWIDGYNDIYSQKNAVVVKKEINQRKLAIIACETEAKKLRKDNKLSLISYLRGCEARNKTLK